MTPDTILFRLAPELFRVLIHALSAMISVPEMTADHYAFVSVHYAAIRRISTGTVESEPVLPRKRVVAAAEGMTAVDKRMV